MKKQIDATVSVATMHQDEAPPMALDTVVSGSFNGEDYTMSRDLMGFNWRVQIGDQTAVFDISEMLEGVLSNLIDPDAGSFKRPS